MVDTDLEHVCLEEDGFSQYELDYGERMLKSKQITVEQLDTIYKSKVLKIFYCQNYCYRKACNGNNYSKPYAVTKWD